MTAEHYLRWLKKLDRPPAGPNWVRLVKDDPLATAKAILAFLKGRPPFSYINAYAGCRARNEDKISLEVALTIAIRSGAPLGKIFNADLVRAFFEYELERGYSASNPVGFDKEYFRISREVAVPVAPLTIIRENGKFVPIFLCGWSSNPLVQRQRRLLMTIWQDAFFSLTDYQNAPGEFLFFPKEKTSDGEWVRRPEVWQRGDYDLLSDPELMECVEIFMAGREIARARLVEEMEASRPGPHGPSGGSGAGPLFQ